MTLQILFPDGPEPTLSDHEARLLWAELCAVGASELAETAAAGTRGRASLTVRDEDVPGFARALEYLWNGAPDHFDSPDNTGPATRPLSVAMNECSERL